MVLYDQLFGPHFETWLATKKCQQTFFYLFSFFPGNLFDQVHFFDVRFFRMTGNFLALLYFVLQTERQTEKERRNIHSITL